MRVQHHASRTLGSGVRRGLTVGLLSLALAVPVTGAFTVTAAADPTTATEAPEQDPSAPVILEAAPEAEAEPGATEPAAPAPAADPDGEAQETDTEPTAPEAEATDPTEAPGDATAPGDPTAPEAATILSIVVNGLDGQPLAIELDPTATVADLKAFLEEHTGVPAADQQLVTDSEVELVDSHTVASYDLAEGDDVNLALV
ncbi:ubiquitin-like domain-containing protein [Nocardia lasii]|uniref:Ubiquitin-like domain-containing protein n=1 Tax=Nocardia lasii TaxID=1616107 RepID=A0ABW1JT00_9NOCA